LTYEADTNLIYYRVSDMTPGSPVVSPANPAFENQMVNSIIVGVCMSIIGLLISLFSYGRLKTISRTD